MKLLLELEWAKTRKYRTFWVFIILFALTLAGVNGILYVAQERLRSASAGQADFGLFGPERLWSTTAWASGFSVLVLGLLVIVLLTNEFVYKTHRQQVMEGLPRSGFVTAKWLTTAILGVYAWVLYVVVTILLGLKSGVSFAEMASGSRFAAFFLLKIAVSLSVAFMWGLWLKRAGLAIVFYLFYVLIGEGIVGFVLNHIRTGLGDFLPLKAPAALVSNPVSRLLPGFGGEGLPEGVLILVACGYVALFVFWSLAYLKKADL